MNLNEYQFFEKYGIRILRAMRRIIRAVDIHSRKLNTEHHTTAPQLLCLYSLAKQEGATLSALAADVNMGLSSVNGIVDRLEQKVLITRTRSQSDRRKLVLHLTPAGRRLVKDAPTLLQDRLAESLRRLPELEQATIALSLERIVKLMEIQHLSASPNLLSGAPLEEKHGEEPSCL